MRYTQYRGLAQVTNWVKLKFAAMNLKKLAVWKWRELPPSFRFAIFRSYMFETRSAPDYNPGSRQTDHRVFKHAVVIFIAIRFFELLCRP